MRAKTFTLLIVGLILSIFIIEAYAVITVDGVYIAGEDWDSVTPIIPPSGNSKCYIYNDENYIYVLVDWLADISNDSDDYNYFRFVEAGIWINVRVYVNGTLEIWPLGTDAIAATGWGSSPNKAEAHRQYEMKCSLFNIGVTVGQRIDRVWIWDKDKSINNGYTWYDGWTDTTAPIGPSGTDPTYVPDDNTDPDPPGDISLPVELSSFTATAGDSKVTLRWRTETETNNIGWNIYRSEKKDGKFVNIGFVRGAGNSAFPHDYNFVDKTAKLGTVYYYYLEDIDVEGNREKSDIVQSGAQRKLSTTWAKLKRR